MEVWDSDIKFAVWWMRLLAYNENDRQHLDESVEESMVWSLLLSLSLVAAGGMASMILMFSAPRQRQRGML